MFFSGYSTKSDLQSCGVKYEHSKIVDTKLKNKSIQLDLLYKIMGFMYTFSKKMLREPHILKTMLLCMDVLQMRSSYENLWYFWNYLIWYDHVYKCKQHFLIESKTCDWLHLRWCFVMNLIIMHTYSAWWIGDTYTNFAEKIMQFEFYFSTI